jgi:hypothetical protein
MGHLLGLFFIGGIRDVCDVNHHIQSKLSFARGITTTQAS